MEYVIKRTIEVTPIKINNDGEESAAKVGMAIRDTAPARELKVVDYIWTDCLLVLVSGNIGNAREQLLSEIDGEIISKEEAETIINSTKRKEYPELCRDLTSIYE